MPHDGTSRQFPLPAEVSGTAVLASVTNVSALYGAFLAPHTRTAALLYLFCMPLLHADDGHRERNALHTQRAVLDFAAVRGCCRVIANPTVTRQAVFKLACVSRSSKFHVCGLSERRARATQLQFTGR